MCDEMSNLAFCCCKEGCSLSPLQSSDRTLVLGIKCRSHDPDFATQRGTTKEAELKRKIPPLPFKTDERRLSHSKQPFGNGSSMWVNFPCVGLCCVSCSSRNRWVAEIIMAPQKLEDRVKHKEAFDFSGERSYCNIGEGISPVSISSNCQHASTFL